ncbi:hypothetical protein Fot_22296 [Forsythia ovata]|uniref:Uncharacterized protein n=1 Tax=Forsythia ovata TaxID=205694 RepID=A0ABD1UXA7_9LAMI
MAKAKDNHTQHRYNHGGHANGKSSYDNAHRQTERRQRTYQRLFPATRSSYTSEITEAIPNFHIGLYTPNQGMATGQTGPASLKSHLSSHTTLTIGSTGIAPRTAMTYRNW